VCRGRGVRNRGKRALSPWRPHPGPLARQPEGRTAMQGIATSRLARVTAHGPPPFRERNATQSRSDRLESQAWGAGGGLCGGEEGQQQNVQASLLCNAGRAGGWSGAQAAAYLGAPRQRFRAATHHRPRGAEDAVRERGGAPPPPHTGAAARGAAPLGAGAPPPLQQRGREPGGREGGQRERCGEQAAARGRGAHVAGAPPAAPQVEGAEDEAPQVERAHRGTVPEAGLGLRRIEPQRERRRRRQQRRRGRGAAVAAAAGAATARRACRRLVLAGAGAAPAMRRARGAVDAARAA
jgi:hypothetical protein